MRSNWLGKKAHPEIETALREEELSYDDFTQARKQPG
jgi:hypothetical protein